MAISRRKALQLSGLAVAATAAVGCSNTNNPQPNSTPHQETKSNDYKAPIADSNNPRVVIVGGGWSGLSIAKYTKIFAPNADVILVEQRHEFVSCPMSNLWLVDKIDLEYLTHDYLQAARENKYTYFHATAVDLDKENRILKTSDGDISFDYLVFAPGIDYDYSRWTQDIAFERRLRQEYPAGFIPGSEHITLRNKILNFKGGNFILTVPSGNYRCLPAPYERACVIADYFKQNKIKGKVVLLDENNAITIKKDGFQSAFDELYGDYLEYMPNTVINNIDLDNKIVETEFDEIEFNDAAFYPHVRGAKILERCGIAKDAKNMLEGDINPLTYEVNGLENILITGDSRPMGFSKSAIITALEKNEELEETIKGAIEEITTHTLNEKTPNTLRVKSILTTILSSAAYVADATPNSATEILKGTLRGIRVGLTKSINKFNKQLQYMPDEAKMILIDDYASLEQELNHIDALFNSVISDVSSQSSQTIQDILTQVSSDMKFDMDKLIQAAKETADTMKERFSDIKYDALQQSSKVMNSKTAKEAKRMGIYAWSVAKSAIDGAIKGAKEKMDKE